MSLKNPLIPAGIEPATFQFVAQHLNHCATADFRLSGNILNTKLKSNTEILLLKFSEVFKYKG